MTGFYDKAQYGFRMRKWFGLGPKWGGDGVPYYISSFATFTVENAKVAGGFFLGTHDPGTITHVEKWYPQGPISVKKVGVFVCSTLANASGGCMNFKFLTRGASASVIATLRMASCTVAEGAIGASKAQADFTVDHAKAGEYLSIQSYEPTTRSATATEVKATTSGRVAFFVDYVPKYDGDRWGDNDL